MAAIVITKSIPCTVITYIGSQHEWRGTVEVEQVCRKVVVHLNQFHSYVLVRSKEKFDDVDATTSTAHM